MFYGTYKLMMDRYRYTAPGPQETAEQVGIREFIARRQLRQDLLALSDRRLDDLGFSRDLLDMGIKHWPWRSDAAQDAGKPISADTTTAQTSGRQHDAGEVLPAMALQRLAA